MFETVIAGSLPKPSWLSETEKLWPQWKLAGDELRQAKADATLLWIKAQEDAGLDIVGDGEQSRQHFVHYGHPQQPLRRAGAASNCRAAPQRPGARI
jgi:5-methyltetrahydropteroyltriglutamate--homocysteine methyltransferase